ncbi:MAG: hypothetical protein ABSF46_00020 [Terriglobia bacterium]|jgi:hypothetical protein
MKRITRKWFGTGALSLGLLLAAGIPASAKESRRIDLEHAIVVQGKKVPAGWYKVEWQTHSPEATVHLLQEHKLVVATEGRLELRDRTNSCDSVLYETMPDGSLTLLEIRFAGSNKVLVFNH